MGQALGLLSFVGSCLNLFVLAGLLGVHLKLQVPPHGELHELKSSCSPRISHFPGARRYMLRITLQSTLVDVERDDVEAEHVQRSYPDETAAPAVSGLGEIPTRDLQQFRRGEKGTYTNFHSY